MKYKITLIVALLISGLSYAQVGIGTTAPKADLHVAGDMLVQDAFKVGTLTTVGSTEEDFKLVARKTNSNPVGELSVLDVQSISVAPVNLVNYHFSNIDSDNIEDLDLQYDTSKYIVGVANFRYVGDALEKLDYDATKKSIGQFVVRTFENGGTWHLEIRNRILDLQPSDSVEYYVTLVVYDKSYFRNLPSIHTDLGGGFTGTASSVPVLN
ncbi:hypothetical protein POV27_10905 [Aureisphaera galaxeae]|uniref:hypothetical protein n=1 Tax=Aureisphaera galaxeae TaxID=1538023 RepID=UPI002350C32F|nr:hypothetical protein [Aureisphaera galaxeae]MDC8004558.1 hypothetical protein [Aureisphaera galaxeae]